MTDEVKPPMSIDDTLIAVECCESIPRKCGKCPLHQTCVDFHLEYNGRQKLKKSIRYWLQQNKELITELAIEKQKQISNMKSELQDQTALMDIQYQNAMIQKQLPFR